MVTENGEEATRVDFRLPLSLVQVDLDIAIVTVEDDEARVRVWIR